jgi:hypothetical protein
VRPIDSRYLVQPLSPTDRDRVSGATAVTFPDPPVVAVLPVDAVPTAPPDSLAPYVVRVATPSADDWVLTDDAIAFGADLVVQHYLGWRSTWVRELELDPLTSLLVLADVLDDGETAARWGNDWFAGRSTRVSDPAFLADCLAVAHETVLARGETGWGFVNATPGRPTIGLARAWSPAGGSHVLAATAEVRVTIEREAGVCVHLDDPSDDRHRDHVVGVDEVLVEEDAVHVIAASGRLELDHRQARPLAWVVPGAMRWRVRQVPEVLVWAKTFHRLALACEASIRGAVPLELRVGFPIAATAPLDRPA